MACPFCLSDTHAMALEVGPDSLCFEAIRSSPVFNVYAPVVSAYFAWQFGEVPFSALLRAAQPTSPAPSAGEGARGPH